MRLNLVRKVRGLFDRIAHEWRKNDGLPWEEWRDGRSLKEWLLIVLMALCVMASFWVIIADLLQ